MLKMGFTLAGGKKKKKHPLGTYLARLSSCICGLVLCALSPIRVPSNFPTRDRTSPVGSSRRVRSMRERSAWSTRFEFALYSYCKLRAVTSAMAADAPGTQGSTLPHGANRLCKPLWPNRYHAGQTYGTQKRNGLPSASGTHDKSETFRLLRKTSGRSLWTIVHPGHEFHWPTRHTRVRTMVPHIYTYYRAKAEPPKSMMLKVPFCNTFGFSYQPFCEAGSRLARNGN